MAFTCFHILGQECGLAGARSVMSSTRQDCDSMHTENMSMLLDALNTRQHFPGVVDLAKRLQAFMTSHSKAIASKDLLRIMKDAHARGSGVDSARLSVCLPNLVSFSPGAPGAVRYLPDPVHPRRLHQGRRVTIGLSEADTIECPLSPRPCTV